MGQGTESCGGYDIEYDAYDSYESDNFNKWTGRDGRQIWLHNMETSHIYGCINHCQNMSDCATFSSETQKWDNWVDSFRAELDSRQNVKTATETKPVAKKPKRGRTKKRTCQCGVTYKVRVADLNRGWGLSCSKSCASKRRESKKT